MAQPQEFPFNIMDVAELLHLHIRRRQADSVYADCPICGDKRGKMNINFAKNLWRCNYCNEGGGMLSLYGKVYGISNSEAYREICDTLQNGLTAPAYTAKVLPEQAAIEQSVLASPQEIHQTFSMLLELLTLTPQHRKHLREVRGLTDEQIERLGYKSTPPFYLCRSLAQKLRSRGCKVEGVPGFYVGKDDKWTVNFNSVTAGIIIPAKGIDGMIRGAQIRLDTPKLMMPLPEEARLYMGQHQISYAPEYRMDRSGNLYMYLERLNAAVEAEGVFACDAGGHPPVFSAVCEGTRFLPVYTYEEAVERLEQAEAAG